MNVFIQVVGQSGPPEYISDKTCSYPKISPRFIVNYKDGRGTVRYKSLGLIGEYQDGELFLVEEDPLKF